MPYRSTIFRAGEHYHVYNRGNNRQAVFFERENYLFFLKRWREYLSAAADTVAYCLMPNHYHFLVRLRDDDFSGPMQAFSLAYTKSVNQRYGRVGGLFQGRFRAIRVDSDPYLLHLSRYIHRNPVPGLVQRAEDWEYSSYRDYLGIRKGTLPNPEIVVAQLGSPAAYGQFVESCPSPTDLDVSHLLLE